MFCIALRGCGSLEGEKCFWTYYIDLVCLLQVGCVYI